MIAISSSDHAVVWIDDGIDLPIHSLDFHSMRPSTLSARDYAPAFGKDAPTVPSGFGS